MVFPEGGTRGIQSGGMSESMTEAMSESGTTALCGLLR